MDGIFKRILLITGIAAVAAAILLISVFAYIRVQTGKIEDVIYGYNDFYISCFTSEPDGDLSDKLDEYLNGKAYDTISRELASAATYIGAGTKTVNKYEKTVLEADVDFKYGKTVATVRSYVAYDGWGEYISGETNNIKYNGNCTDEYTLEKADGKWKIIKIKTEYKK